MWGETRAKRRVGSVVSAFTALWNQPGAGGESRWHRPRPAPPGRGPDMHRPERSRTPPPGWTEVCEEAMDHNEPAKRRDGNPGNRGNRGSRRELVYLRDDGSRTGSHPGGGADGVTLEVTSRGWTHESPGVRTCPLLPRADRIVLVTSPAPVSMTAVQYPHCHRPASVPAAGNRPCTQDGQLPARRTGTAFPSLAPLLGDLSPFGHACLTGYL